jgi:hypothetical protein
MGPYGWKILKGSNYTRAESGQARYRSGEYLGWTRFARVHDPNFSVCSNFVNLNPILSSVCAFVLYTMEFGVADGLQPRAQSDERGCLHY